MQIGKALVTGASGFIGSALARKLQQSASDVRLLVRNRQKLPQDLATLDVMEGDITEAASVERAMGGIDTVFHIAAAFREPGLSDQAYHNVNVQGTCNVVQAAADRNVRRVVHCSTSGIHGNINGVPAGEDHPLVLDEVYEQTKAEAERAALRIGRERDVEVTVLRPSQVYGPGDTRLVKLFKMVNSKMTVWFGPGTAHYHLLYIDDLVEAFVLAGKTEAANGQAFLIAGRELPSLNELVEAIAAALGKQPPRLLRLPAGPFLLLGTLCERVCVPIGINPPIYRRRVEFFIKNKAYDITKARDMLGFEPRTGMTAGLERTVQWCRSTGRI